MIFSKVFILIKKGPFILTTPYLGKFHQQLWITAKPIISGRKEDFSHPFVLNVHLHDSNDGDTTKKDDTDFKMKSRFHSEYFNRTRYLHCSNEVSTNLNF